MPRGPGVWKNTGKSFADLSKSDAGPGPGSSAYGAQAAQTSQTEHRAGVTSTQRPRGAGSFAAESTWSLGNPSTSSSMQSVTEAKTQFRPPPEGLRRQEPFSLGTSFPHPNYPHDRKTLNQITYNPDLLKGAQRSQIIKPRTGERLLPQDVTPQYETAYKTLHKDFTPEAKAGSRAGNPAAKPPGYNIITGGPALGNNIFEYFDQGRDYKRHR